MENRARYVLIGLFTLAVIVAGFGFVYWLNNTAGLGERAIYQVRFDSPVSGLRAGSSVLFNGIRVGEVTQLELDPANPKQVTATINVEQGTPIRSDTQVGVDFQGLMGAASISLRGGSATAAALPSQKDRPPLLVAEPGATQDMSQAAREALQRLDAILADNAEPLKNTIANINTFSGVLARNSDRLDNIVQGLERMTGGGAPKPAPPVYDLAAPRDFPPMEKAPRGQLAVLEPTALVMFDTQRILVRPSAESNPALANAQWGDSIPKLIQAKIIQSFENANFLKAVGRPMDGFNAEYQLALDIRSFQISTSPSPTADVEFAAKILGDNGRIVDARVFHATAPAKDLNPSGAVGALEQAFDKVATELVVWASRAI